MASGWLCLSTGSIWSVGSCCYMATPSAVTVSPRSPSEWAGLLEAGSPRKEPGRSHGGRQGVPTSKTRDCRADFRAQLFAQKYLPLYFLTHTHLRLPDNANPDEGGLL